MKKRTWMYVQPPTTYEIFCDLCDGSNIYWSEYEGMIWCYDCEKDTVGTWGIFDGPVGAGACEALGISLDRIDLETGEILKFSIQDDKVVYVKTGEFAELKERKE